MNDLSNNPYAAPTSPPVSPQGWSLTSPLLRDGWAHWAGRLILISVGVGLVSAVCGSLASEVYVLFPGSWWYVLPGTIVSSLPAWALGLSFRGFRSATSGKRFAAGNYMAAVFAMCLLGVLLLPSLIDGGMYPGNPRWANWLANAIRTPAQIVMLAFVTFTWGGRVRWLRLIVLSVGGVLLWNVIQWFMVILIYQATQLPAAQAALFFAFEDAAIWTLSFGVVLPFATATGRVDE